MSMLKLLSTIEPRKPIRIYGSIMLLERKENLEQLKNLVVAALNGQGGIALVAGEAGIGKTSLLTAFHQEVSTELDSQIELAWGGSDPLFTPRALGPLHDIAHCFSDEIKNLLQENANSTLLFDAILKFLGHRSKTHVFIFEDVHWADHATLDFLKFLSRRITFLNVVVVISFRNDEIDKLHPLNEVLAVMPPGKTVRVDLQPLSVNSIKLLLKEVDHENKVNEQEIYLVTGGNPFFVTELLASKQSSVATVPASIRDAITARINRLDIEEQNFLETISIIPKAVSIDLLNRLFEQHAETFAMACVGRGLLTLVGTDMFRFRHELARLGTAERLSALEKKRQHARILEALLDIDADLELDHLVHHAAGAFDAKRVLEFAPQAAKIASISGSHREAAAHYSTALRFVDSAQIEKAAQLYECWAMETGLTVGIDDEVIEARRHAITLWRAIGNKEKIGENLRWLSRLLWYQGQASEALRYVDEAIKVLEDSPPSSEKAMAFSLRSQFFMLNDYMDDAIHWGEKALALEAKFNDVAVRVHALNNIGTARVFRGNKTGVENLLESLKLSQEHNLHVDAARVYTNLSEYAVKYKDFKLAEESIADGIAFDTKHDLDSWTYYLVGRLAELRLLQGKIGEAKVIAEGVLKLDQLTLLMKLPALLVLSRIYLVTNDSRAKEYLDQALNDARSTDEYQHIIPARLALVEYAWLKNDNDYAYEQLKLLYKIGEMQTDPWTIGELLVWGKRINIDLEYAYSIDLPEPYMHELNGDLTKAANAWEKLGLPYAAAIALSSVREKKNYALLNRAIKLLEPLGASALTLKIKERAAELGILDELNVVRRGPYRSAQAHPLGLTKKEQEIFKLMIEGNSNRAIADALARSQRTIEHHVSSILKKMNVESRMDAMLRVQNEPWLLT